MTSETPEDFAEDTPGAPRPGEQLLLDLEGFEGPIDVLLQLARDQKVDLTRISILALAEQYLEFVRAARRFRLELAADYLVMAAWLAYLKSRLLLPEPEEEGEEPSGAELAAALKFQLQRLQAMQDAGQKLLDLPQLGRERFPCGSPMPPVELTRVRYDLSLFELLSAYGSIRSRARESAGLRILAMDLYSVEEAIRRLSGLLGDMPGWRTLAAFLPADLSAGITMRSAIASTFVASLELCKAGRLELRQEASFGPIYLRGRAPEEARDRDS